MDDFLVEEFESKTGSIFRSETDLPLLLVEASRIYAKQITLARFTQVAFTVHRDRAKRSFCFVLQSGAYIADGLIAVRDVKRIEELHTGIKDRFLKLISELKLQERLLEVAGAVNQQGRFDGIVSDALNASTPGNSLASEDENELR